MALLGTAASASLNPSSVADRPMRAFADAIGKVTDAADAAVAPFEQLGNSLGKFVSQANPVAFQQFQFALKDLLATIGQALAPALNVVTDLTRAFADALTPFVDNLGSAVADVLQPFADVLKVVFDLMADLGPAMASAFKAIAPVLALVAEGLKRVIEFLADGVRAVLELLGVEVGRDGTPKGASAGRAVRSASTTDVESVLRKARETAFSLGAGAAPAAERTASAAEAIKAKFDALIAEVKALPEQIAKWLKDTTVGKAVTGVVDTARGFRDDIRAADPVGSFRKFASDPFSTDSISDAVARRVAEIRARTGEGDGVVTGGVR